jgi:hypothetical protein
LVEKWILEKVFQCKSICGGDGKSMFDLEYYEQNADIHCMDCNLGLSDGGNSNSHEKHLKYCKMTAIEQFQS